MLQLQHLCRNYRGIPAIQDVTFQVAPGEIVGFLGPNGAGKSTTVKIITGMLRPDDGRVLFEGQDTAKDMVAFRAAFSSIVISLASSTCSWWEGSAGLAKRSSKPRRLVCSNS